MSLLVLSREECLQRLRTASVGRVATTHRAMPAILPVNYTLLDDSVCFRTEPGGILARACDDAVVAFEIDDIAPDGHSGWSVMVVGTAHRVDADDAARRGLDDLPTALDDDRSQVVAIAIGTVTGRAVELPVAIDLSA
jgi:nitroimidazol reductase NimA-like FMN-containing flavoprotein (pyridoxamine 5'-phosphate oxidase superfamily)